VDLRARYDRKTASLGEFIFDTNASFTNHFRTQALPSSALIETAGAGGPLRWRGYSAVTWLKGDYGVTLTGRYIGHYASSTTAASPAFRPPAGWTAAASRPTCIGTSSLPVRFLIRFMPGAGRPGSPARKWTLGVLNVLNEQPSLVSDVQSAFYNRQDDPRQRYVYLQSANRSNSQPEHEDRPITRRFLALALAALAQTGPDADALFRQLQEAGAAEAARSTPQEKRHAWYDVSYDRASRLAGSSPKNIRPTAVWEALGYVASFNRQSANPAEAAAFARNSRRCAPVSSLRRCAGKRARAGLHLRDRGRAGNAGVPTAGGVGRAGHDCWDATSSQAGA